ncbi:MAG: hypothetical protein NTX22_18400 [Ignavibacteriales bacterium]|nr:hypothetical protein [Ignavibacteriales bacterium]
MNCESVNKIIYLKSEELSRSESRTLYNHLSVCNFCRIERHKFEAANEIITKLKKVEPAFENPTLCEDIIIERIQQIKKDIPESIFNKLFNKLADFFEISFVRYSLISVLLIAFSLFFYEEATTVIDISRLEESTAVNFNNEITAGGIFEDQTKMLNTISELCKLFTSKRNIAKLTDDWIVMNKAELRSFLQLNSKLNAIKTTLPSNFNVKYPLLAKYINMELSDKQVEEFINQKDEIIVELNKFLKEGELKNEIPK